MAKKLFLIIGAPGSGKTTDAEIIAERNPDTVVHYSTGEMLRQEVASGSELGKEIENYISKGALVPLNIVIDTIINAVKNAPKDIILIDGFPRSTEQMKALDGILQNEKDVELKAVIEVRVSEAVAKERILGRAEEAEVKRSDDNEEVFYQRMKIYLDPLPEIEAFYKEKGLLKIIDGERPIEPIVNEMEAFVKEKAAEG
ncbi:MAG TPA: adenylate kinase [Nitratifractor salsuginis]|uniref:Adenylate kinase n=1 Tax=Nitratifractor salsuginis TaxID=269261 RepID=A0A7V2SIU7_9BACT|nr:adenylate kinase [Nitratifractor salsuginis]